jgi:hypothetical protein
MFVHRAFLYRGSYLGIEIGIVLYHDSQEESDCYMKTMDYLHIGLSELHIHWPQQ